MPMKKMLFYVKSFYVKATGADGIPAKIIKCSKSIIAPQITSILNMSMDQSVFPDKLKKA